MSTDTKAKKFARKYGKKYRGRLCLEACTYGEDLVKHEKLKDIAVPEQIVTLNGYIQHTPAMQAKTGKEGHVIRTGYVVGFAIHDGELFAITPDSVYLLYGPWMAEIIKKQPFLNSLWEDLKKGVVAEALNK